MSVGVDLASVSNVETLMAILTPFGVAIIPVREKEQVCRDQKTATIVFSQLCIQEGELSDFRTTYSAHWCADNYWITDSLEEKFTTIDALIEAIQKLLNNDSRILFFGEPTIIVNSEGSIPVSKDIRPIWSGTLSF